MNWLKTQLNKYQKIIISLLIGGILLAVGMPDSNFKLSAAEDKMLKIYNQSVEIKAKYQIDRATLIKTEIKNAELDKYKNEPKDEIKITLGDRDKTEFAPNLELKRWNEVSFKIKTDNLLAGVETKDKNLSFEDEKIKFDTPKMSFEMYDYTEGEGGYKFIWYLNEKPASNKVEFQIESSGLDFFYQPPLTEEYQNGYSEEFQKEIVVSETQVKDLEGNVLVERPENVVGSYAVYHQTKGGMNDVWGKEYKTGKAFHIYRPRIIDAEGKETWGILHIENGIYSVEIPQDFLDTAIYPIKSNDDFGYTSLGAFSQVTYLANATDDTSTAVGKTGDAGSTPGTYPLTVDGNITQMSVGMIASATGQSLDLFFALYREDSEGANVHALVASAESLDVAVGVTASFKSINFASEFLSADTYILTALGNGEDLSGYVRVRYDTGGSGLRSYIETSTGAGSYATRKAEDPWGVVDSASTQITSFYATYTPSGGGAAAQSVRVIINNVRMIINGARVMIP